MKVFLSYSRLDKRYAKKLIASLQNDNVCFWFDEYNILIGHVIQNKIFDAIRKSDYFLLILTPHSVNSAWVQKELSEALITEMEKNKTFILPLVFEPCTMPAALEKKHNANFTQYSSGWHELMKVLKDTPPSPKNTVDNIRLEFDALWEAYIDEQRETFNAIKTRCDESWDAYNGDEESHTERIDSRRGINEFLLELTSRALSDSEKKRLSAILNYQTKTIDCGWSFVRHLTDKVKNLKSTPDLESAIIAAIYNGYQDSTGLISFSRGGNSSLFREIMIHANLHNVGFLTPEERHAYLNRPLQGFTKSIGNDSKYCRKCGTLLSEKFDHLEYSSLISGSYYNPTCNNSFCPDYGHKK